MIRNILVLISEMQVLEFRTCVKSSVLYFELFYLAIDSKHLHF